ncbi:MAG TPA: 50S ribosomal protein L35 [Micavibrio sp.]|jgi:large subunit ribosomal protein L35
MPKMKTKSGAKKRFRVTATGRVKAKHAHKRHRLISKPKSMKRKARGMAVLSEPDSKIIRDNFLPYARKTKRRSNTSKRPTAKAGE